MLFFRVQFRIVVQKQNVIILITLEAYIQFDQEEMTIKSPAQSYKILFDKLSKNWSLPVFLISLFDLV